MPPRATSRPARACASTTIAASFWPWPAWRRVSVPAPSGRRPCGGGASRATAATPTTPRRSARPIWGTGRCSTTTSWTSRSPTDRCPGCSLRPHRAPHPWRGALPREYAGLRVRPARAPGPARSLVAELHVAAYPETFGALRRSPYAAPHRARRSVKDELRANLIDRVRAGGPIFAGVLGYDDTVVPQLVNAILSRHNFILLGLRGQAKSRILRALTTLLDPHMPYLAGCEIHDSPYAPICRRCREEVTRRGDETAIAWLARSEEHT